MTKNKFDFWQITRTEKGKEEERNEHVGTHTLPRPVGDHTCDDD